MRRTLVPHALAAATLLWPLLGCCFFSAPPPPLSSPLPLPPAPVLPAPFTVERSILGLQLVVDAPASAETPAPADLEPGSAGMLMRSYLRLVPDGAALLAVDLPCIAPSGLEARDFGAGLQRELARRHPTLGPLTALPLRVRDPSLPVVELVPVVPFHSPDNEVTVAFFGVDLGTHVALLRAVTGRLGASDEGSSSARALVESVVLTLRRGSFLWTATLEGSTYGDLFDSVDAPEGWVSRTSSCCNEEPPYVSHFRESVIPLRRLGEPARARVSARSGGCPAGVTGPLGSMFGAPMTWSRTATGLCWVARSPDGDDDLGVSYRVRGATEGDLAQALAVAATVSRD